MKILLTICASVLCILSSFGQMMTYITTFKTNHEGITVAELSLIHRSRSNCKDIRDLGKRMIQISSQINGIPLTMERSRFNVHESTPFELDGTLYVPVELTHDNNTKDPRDDLRIVTIPFPVETKLVLAEMSFYEDQSIQNTPFVEVPQGPKQEIKPIQRIR